MYAESSDSVFRDRFRFIERTAALSVDARAGRRPSSPSTTRFGLTSLASPLRLSRSFSRPREALSATPRGADSSESRAVVEDELYLSHPAIRPARDEFVLRLSVEFSSAAVPVARPRQREALSSKDLERVNPV